MELSCAANGPFVTWVYCSHRLEACGGSSSQHSAVAAISEIKTTTKAGPKAKGHNVAALRLWLCFRPNNGRISRSDAMRTLSFAGQLPGKKGDGAWPGQGIVKDIYRSAVQTSITIELTQMQPLGMATIFCAIQALFAWQPFRMHSQYDVYVVCSAICLILHRGQLILQTARELTVL